MKNLVELQKRELLDVNGGDAYSVGRRVGYACGRLLGHLENALEGFYKILTTPR